MRLTISILSFISAVAIISYIAFKAGLTTLFYIAGFSSVIVLAWFSGHVMNSVENVATNPKDTGKLNAFESMLESLNRKMMELKAEFERGKSEVPVVIPILATGASTDQIEPPTPKHPRRKKEE